LPDAYTVVAGASAGAATGSSPPISCASPPALHRQGETGSSSGTTPERSRPVGGELRCRASRCRLCRRPSGGDPPRPHDRHPMPVVPAAFSPLTCRFCRWLCLGWTSPTQGP